MANNATTTPNKLQPGRAGNGGVGLVTIPQQPNAPVISRMRDILTSPAEDRVIVTHVTTGAKEIVRQLHGHFQVEEGSDHIMHRAQAEARARKLSFSQLLEDFDPSEQYKGTELEGLDAFERQLHFAGIRVKSQPEKGIYADNVNRFFQSNVPGSQVLFPEFINRVMRQALIAPDVLPQIIAVTTGVTGSHYRTIRTNDTVAQRRMQRVGQGAEMPKTSLTTGEYTINLYKYGRILEGSYEFFREVQIDLFTILLQRMAMQANLDKADAAIDVAINGDGNSNPATNYNQSTLDTGSTPTYKAFIAFALKFFPYKLTRLVGSDAAFINFISMARPSVDPYQILNVLQQGGTFSQRVELAQDIYTDVQLVYLPSVASGVLVGLDNRFALEMVMENGASIVETDRLISSQRNQIAVSEKVGFDQIFNQAIATWTTTA